MELTSIKQMQQSATAKELSGIVRMSDTLASMQPLPQSSSTDRSRQLLASVWQRSLPLVRERVIRLQQATEHCDFGLVTAEARIEASDIAHKLAGSLGMFGYNRGTEIAREIELLLDGDTPVSVHRYEGLVASLGSVLPL